MRYSDRSAQLAGEKTARGLSVLLGACPKFDIFETSLIVRQLGGLSPVAMQFACTSRTSREKGGRVWLQVKSSDHGADD